jgi:hypothetical protein
MSSENLKFYEIFRAVPENAKKPIKGGRLNGMTDINPMWRIKMLTEQFGMCGVGWYYDVVKMWIDEGADGVKVSNVITNLYVKVDGEWSKPIQGIGGSTLVAKEKAVALYTSDEHFKMALTDSLSVCCKAIVIRAEVYWDKDRTKYDSKGDEGDDLAAAVKAMSECKTEAEVTKCWNDYPSLQTDVTFRDACIAVQKVIKGK